MSNVKMDNNNNCSQCKKKINSKKNTLKLQCYGICRNWYCGACTGLENESIREINSDVEKRWFCKLCKTRQHLRKSGTGILSRNNTSKVSINKTLDDTIDGEVIYERLELIISNQTSHAIEFQKMQSEIKELKEHLNSMIEENITLRNELQCMSDEILQNKMELEKMKQKQIERQIEISGIKDEHNGTEPLDIIKKLGNEIDMLMEPNIISNISKTKKISEKSGEPYKLIVEFTNIENKSTFMNLIKKKTITMDIIYDIDTNKNDQINDKDKSENDRIFVNEKLTPYFSYLAKKARDMKRSNIIEFTWIKNGKLFIRKNSKSKIIRILHESHLNVE